MICNAFVIFRRQTMPRGGYSKRRAFREYMYDLASVNLYI